MVLCWSSMCPSVHPSIGLSYVRPAVFSFPVDNLINCQWIFSKLGMYIDIVGSGLRLLMDIFRQFLIELSVQDTSDF